MKKSIERINGTVTYHYTPDLPMAIACDFNDHRAVGVQQWYDTQTRSWVTYMECDQHHQIGSADFDGHKDDAKASLVSRMRKVEAHR